MSPAHRQPVVWQNLPADLTLGNAEILVVGVDPVLTPEAERAFLKMLSADEKHRAENIHNDESRQQFIACRQALRLILAKLTGSEPASMKIANSHFGKPWLVMPAGVVPWHFSVAHTSSLGLIAVARNFQVGIDVERIEPLDIDQIKRTALTRQETWLIDQTPNEHRLSRFYQLWTRKEALLKAAGVGFQVEPASVDVTSHEAESQITIRLQDSSGQDQEWLINDFVPSPLSLGALAYSNTSRATIHFRWVAAPVTSSFNAQP